MSGILLEPSVRPRCHYLNSTPSTSGMHDVDENRVRPGSNRTSVTRSHRARFAAPTCDVPGVFEGTRTVPNMSGVGGRKRDVRRRPRIRPSWPAVVSPASPSSRRNAKEAIPAPHWAVGSMIPVQGFATERSLGPRTACCNESFIDRRFMDSDDASSHSIGSNNKGLRERQNFLTDLRLVETLPTVPAISIASGRPLESPYLHATQGHAWRCSLRRRHGLACMAPLVRRERDLG